MTTVADAALVRTLLEGTKTKLTRTREHWRQRLQEWCRENNAVACGDYSPDEYLSLEASTTPSLFQPHYVLDEHGNIVRSSFWRWLQGKESRQALERNWEISYIRARAHEDIRRQRAEFAAEASEAEHNRIWAEFGPFLQQMEANKAQRLAQERLERRRFHYNVERQRRLTAQKEAELAQRGGRRQRMLHARAQQPPPQQLRQGQQLQLQQQQQGAAQAQAPLQEHVHHQHQGAASAAAAEPTTMTTTANNARSSFTWDATSRRAKLRQAMNRWRQEHLDAEGLMGGVAGTPRIHSVSGYGKRPSSQLSSLLQRQQTGAEAAAAAAGARGSTVKHTTTTTTATASPTTTTTTNPMHHRSLHQGFTWNAAARRAQLRQQMTQRQWDVVHRVAYRKHS